MTHDTLLIRLEFPNPDWIAGGFAGSHYKLYGEIDGKPISKMYSPISAVNQKGYSDFAIKVYRKSVEFPNGGVFSQHLENDYKVGDYITCSGPVGMIRYMGWGKFIFKKVE